jgi:hypothetical protein
MTHGDAEPSFEVPLKPKQQSFDRNLAVVFELRAACLGMKDGLHRDLTRRD